MVIKIYNNIIMAPVKCGSRYLDKVWESERTEYIHYQYLKFPKVKYIVIREPMSHLITALHTETVGFINEFGRRDDFYHQLNDFISVDGATHWCVPFYEYLYYYRNKYGEDIEVVKLENLTELLKNLGHNIQYVPEEYHFKKYEKWWSKEDLFKMLKEMYPKEINWLIDKVETQKIYYEKLLNNEININLRGNVL
jgi:hypothetical protein